MQAGGQAGAVAGRFGADQPRQQGELGRAGDRHDLGEPLHEAEGSRDKNFYNALAVRMGFDEAAAEIQDRYLARDYDGAAQAVPYDFIEQTSLLGSKERIAEKMQVLAAGGVTTLTVSPFGASQQEKLASLRTAVEALERSGVGS